MQQFVFKPVRCEFSKASKRALFSVRFIDIPYQVQMVGHNYIAVYSYQPLIGQVLQTVYYDHFKDIVFQQMFEAFNCFCIEIAIMWRCLTLSFIIEGIHCTKSEEKIVSVDKDILIVW